MGILERTRHVIRADLNALLKKAKNPEVVLEAYLDDLEAVLEEVVSIQTAEESERDMYAARLRDLHAAQRTWEKKAAACVERGDEELARSALERKHDLQDEVEGLAEEMAQRDESLEILVGSVESLRERMREVNRRRRELRFRRQILVARSELQDALSRLGHDQDEPLVAQAQQRLGELEGRLEAEEALRQHSLDDRVLRMEANDRRSKRSAAVERELAQIRRKLKGSRR